MKPARKRRRWWLRIPAGMLVMLVVLLAAIWFSLPRLIEWGGSKAARDFGFDEATVSVERADLAGFRARELRARMGGLAVALERAGADYGVGRLRDGAIDSIAVHGLVVTLDFTLPRQSLLPDAVTEILSHFGGGGELVWPVGHMTLEDCALQLVLPGGPQTFALSGRADKQADGRVAFELRSEHPEQKLHVAGAIRTETLDGDVTVHELTLSPQFLLGLARQLGLFTLPEGTQLESTPITITGGATLKAGLPETATVAVRAAEVRGGATGIDARIQNLEIDARRAVGGTLSGRVKAAIDARATDNAWSAGPLLLDLALEDGRVRGVVPAFPASMAETARGRLGLEVDAGIPQLGGPAHASLALKIDEAAFGQYALAPALLRAEGWLDELKLTATPLRLLADSPASIVDLVLTAGNLLGAERAFDLSLGLTGEPAALEFLPASITIGTPALPHPIIRLTAKATQSEAGVKAAGRIETTIDELAVEMARGAFACVPKLGVDFRHDGASVAGTLSLEASDIVTSLPGFPPGVNALSLGLEIPPVTTSALAAFAGGKVPAEDFSVTLKGSVVRSSAQGNVSFLVRRHGDNGGGWSAGLGLLLENVTGVWAGARVEGMRFETTLDTGALPDALLESWLADPRIDAIGPELLTRAHLQVAATANAVEMPGVARLEWLSAAIDKPAKAIAGNPPVSATLMLNAGNLRTGPEVIEQPSIELVLTGDPRALDARLRVSAMIEGGPLALTADQRLAIDWNELSLKGGGDFALQPFSLANSDVVTRWKPTLPGVSVSGTVAAGGSVSYSSRGEWDGAARLDVTGASVNYPEQRFKGEGIELQLAVKSLKQLNTDPGQVVRFRQLALGDIRVSEGQVRFHTDSATVLHIEGARTSVFGGDVSVGPFSMFFPNLDMAVVLEIEKLDVGQVVREMNMFNGSMTGRLRGRLPVALLAGRPFIGEGFLELDPRYPARMSYEARGTFTKGMPNRNVLDQVNRLPYDLLEDGLASLAISAMRVELFSRDRPDTPIRVEFAGESVTPRAKVPMRIVTNINGTVAEVINLLLRLASM